MGCDRPCDSTVRCALVRVSDTILKMLSNDFEKSDEKGKVVTTRMTSVGLGATAANLGCKATVYSQLVTVALCTITNTNPNSKP